MALMAMTAEFVLQPHPLDIPHDLRLGYFPSPIVIHPLTLMQDCVEMIQYHIYHLEVICEHSFHDKIPLKPEYQHHLAVIQRAHYMTERVWSHIADQVLPQQDKLDKRLDTLLARRAILEEYANAPYAQFKRAVTLVALVGDEIKEIREQHVSLARFIERAGTYWGYMNQQNNMVTEMIVDTEIGLSKNEGKTKAMIMVSLGDM